MEENEAELVLVPSRDRRRQGPMWKKVLSTKGIMWQHRFAVLTKDRLCFTKDESDPEIMDYIPLHEISTINLHEVHPEDETDSRNSSRPTGTGAGNNPRDTNRERLPLEKHLIIATEEGGHNGGRRYFHRLEQKEADGWMADLKESVKEENSVNTSASFRKTTGIVRSLCVA